jgi:hypothetical protein
MEVGVKHPVSLAAFSVVVSRPSRAGGRYLVPRITRSLALVGRDRDSWAAPVVPEPGGPTGAAPCQAIPRPYDLALRSGPGRCCRRGFACYVWDPVTTAGAAGRGSGQAPGGFRGQGCWLASRPSARPARAGLPGRRRGREACPRPACASAWPGPGLFINPACSHRPLGAGCRGARPRPSFESSGVACARNEEGAVSLPLGMSNNA